MGFNIVEDNVFLFNVYIRFCHVFLTFLYIFERFYIYISNEYSQVSALLVKMRRPEAVQP